MPAHAESYTHCCRGATNYRNLFPYIHHSSTLQACKEMFLYTSCPTFSKQKMASVGSGEHTERIQQRPSMGRSESCKHVGRRKGKLIHIPNLFSQIYLVISEKKCLEKTNKQPQSWRYTRWTQELTGRLLIKQFGQQNE